MLAAIDSGNTNVVFAVYEGDTLRGEWRSSSDPNRTADEYAVWLSHLMHLEDLSFDDIDEAIRRLAAKTPKAAARERADGLRHDRGGSSLIPVNRILFGSDYPHPEGVARPLQYLEEFADYRPEEVEKVFSSNLKAMLAGAPL